MVDIDGAQLRARVEEVLNRRPAVGFALGVVVQRIARVFYGHGVADIGSHTPVTENTVFRVGSLTKPSRRSR
jgi:CubicO group peptidase (beta-lactamase class C family)